MACNSSETTMYQLRKTGGFFVWLEICFVTFPGYICCRDLVNFNPPEDNVNMWLTCPELLAACTPGLLALQCPSGQTQSAEGMTTGH